MRYDKFLFLRFPLVTRTSWFINESVGYLFTFKHFLRLQTEYICLFTSNKPEVKQCYGHLWESLNVVRGWSRTWLLDGSLLSCVVFLHKGPLEHFRSLRPGQSPVASLDELEVVVQPDLQQVVVTPLLRDVHYQDLVCDRTDCSQKETLLLFYKIYIFSLLPSSENPRWFICWV